MIIDQKEAVIDEACVRHLAKTSLDFLATLTNDDLYDLPRQESDDSRVPQLHTPRLKNQTRVFPQGHHLSIELLDGLIHAYALIARKTERAPTAIEMIFMPERGLPTPPYKSPSHIQLILRSRHQFSGYHACMPSTCGEPGRDLYGNFLVTRSFRDLDSAKEELKSLAQ